MSIPSNEDILALLAQLDDAIADALESEFLDFKPSLGPKEDLKVACEYAVCFANAAGGVVVFGVADKQRGRAQAIVGTHGHDVDVFKRGIYDGTRPGIEAEVLELSVPEGTGKLLIVRVPEGQQKPYGTAAGLFKQRVGKNCMPLIAWRFNAPRWPARRWTGAVRPPRGWRCPTWTLCSWSVPARCCAARHRPLACLTCQT